MAPRIDVTPVAAREYDVTVANGETTRHHVRVPAELRDRLGVSEADEPRLVRTSFRFLLEREPASAILRDFDLAAIAHYFPEYETEMASRMS